MSRAPLRAGRSPGTWSSPAPHPRNSGVLPMPDPDTISADYRMADDINLGAIVT